MRKLIVLLLPALCAVLSAADSKALFPIDRHPTPRHQPLELIKNGKAQFAFVHNPRAEAHLRDMRFHSADNALKLLLEAFRRCTGQDIPVIDENDTAGQAKYRYLFAVGSGKFAAANGLEPLKMPKGGFAVKTFERGIVLAGYDGSLIKDFYTNMPGAGVTLSGTRNGAVDFLERFLNCRFYFPGELGEIYPERTGLTIKPVHYSDYPRMESRDNYHHMASAFNHAKKWEPYLGPHGDVFRFAALWRLERGSMYVANHCPQPDQWLKAHPDKKELIFYRAPNGHLYYTPTDGHGGKYLDVTNLALADLLVEDWIKFYSSKGKERKPWSWDAPNREYVCFGQADSSVPLPDMENKPIVKELGLITPAHRQNFDGMYSDVYARFFQYLGQQLAKKLPGVRLGLIPYSEYTQPPRLPEYQHLPDNIDLRVCLMQLPGRVRNPEIVKEYNELLAGWSKAQGNRKIHSLWLYNSPDNPFARAMNTRFIGEIPAAFKEHFSGKDVIYGFWFEMDWFYYYSIYVGMRSLWNPDFDVDAALEEHWPLLYGKYAPAAKAFHDKMLECYLKYYVPRREGIVPYPPSEIDKLAAMLAPLEKAAQGDSPEARRCRLFAAPWRQAIAAMRAQGSYTRPVYKANRIDTATPSSADWDAAPEIPLGDPSGDPAPRRCKTSAKMLWSKDGIFARFQAAGNMRILPEKRVFDNCNFEFFLSPGLKQEKYFQWVISAMGQLHGGTRQIAPIAMAYDGLWSCPGFKFEAKRPSDELWTLEFFIPFAGLKVDAPRTYDSWHFNLVRNKRSEPAESSSSCQTRGSNHTVNMYGMIKFAGKKR